MNLAILETTFTPSEVGRMSGVSAAKQRDLRRHGFLPEAKGHARFNAYDAAELMFVQKLAGRGVGPKHAFEVSKVCATGIVWHALSSPNAFSGDHLALIERGIVPDVAWDTKTAEAIEALAQEASDFGKTPDEIRAVLTAEGAKNYRQAAFLQRYITNFYRGRVLPAPYFIWWADNSETWAENLQAAFDDLPDADPKRTGPVIVLSLESLGRELLAAANKPLFEVRLGEVSND